MKQILFLIYILGTSNLCQAQKLNAIYYGISSESLHSGHQLEFINDTSVEISTFPRHMSMTFRLVLKYTREGRKIKIYSPGISKKDSVSLTNNRLGQFINEANLTIAGRAITDNSNKLVYVLYSDFKRKYYLTYLIDGKIYKQETGLTDSYGVIKNNPKENRQLKTILASLKEDLQNYDVKVYRGLDAYSRFGYRCVFGVIELKRKS